MEKDKLYTQYDLKPGTSYRVDEITATIQRCFRTGDMSNFHSAWADLVEGILSDFPNVSHYNLSLIELNLETRGYREEVLFIRLACVRVAPKSTEAHCFLGHAYRRLKRYAEALPSYDKAYELAAELAKPHSNRGNAWWYDASDYLRYKAECQIRLGHLNEALFTLRDALQILKESEGEWKSDRIFHLMRAIFRLQKSSLAEVYRRKELEAKKKR